MAAEKIDANRYTTTPHRMESINAYHRLQPFKHTLRLNILQDLQSRQHGFANPFHWEIFRANQIFPVQGNTGG